MYHSILSFIALACVVTASDEFTVYKVADLNNYLVENLAVRKTGQVLVTTSAPAATLWQIDPFSTLNATLAVRFPGVSGSYGVVELEPDLFYVTTGNFSIQTRQSVPNSFQLFEVNMMTYQEYPNETISSPAHIRSVATFSNATVLNGLTHVDGQSGYVLAADSYAGLIWKADIATGQVTTAIKDASMDPSPGGAAGINGLKYQNGYIYYTNTAASTYYRVPIFPNATASGDPELIANITKGDDLILDDQGTAYICQQVNVLSRVALNGTQEIIAGTIDSDSSSLLGPTATAWGRLPADQNTLYITTNGGQAATAVKDSQGLSRIDLNATTSQSLNSTSTATASTSTGGAATSNSLGKASGRHFVQLLSFLFIIQGLVW